MDSSNGEPHLPSAVACSNPEHSMHAQNTDAFLCRRSLVRSYAYGPFNNYLDYCHPNFSSDDQMSVGRRTFKESQATSMHIPAYTFREAQISYAGAWSRVFASEDRMAAEFTTGALSGLVGSAIPPHPDPRSFTDITTYTNGAVIASDSGYNLHHFLWEHLPAAYLYRDVVKDAGRILVGMSQRTPHPFVEPLLRLIGVGVPVDRMQIHSNVRVENSTFIGTFPFRVYPVDLVLEVRDLVLSRTHNVTTLTGSEVVFLGRGDEERNRRKLVNEDAVLRTIQERWPSLTILRSALTPLSETIEIMRNCKVLIGPTGGALAHILWATEVEYVIELVPHEYPGTTETEEASHMLGFQYHKVPTHRRSDVSRGRWVEVDQYADLKSVHASLQMHGK